jgi:hypothetical protein
MIPSPRFRTPWIGWIVVLSLLAMPLTSTSSFAATPLYSERLNSEQIRFAASVGSGTRWVPQTNQTSAAAGFGGRVALTCSGLNYSAFLAGFDVNDWLNDLKSQFLAGAQAEAMSYLLTLSYSNPTIASVLDFMDHSYQSKFTIFQSACNAQEAKQLGQEIGARRMSEAQNQCYEKEVNGGASPSRAYQTCANQATLGAVVSALPAGQNVADFLRRFTNVTLSVNLLKLLKLLPDEQVSSSGHQVRPPELTLHSFNANVASRSTNALNKVLAGDAPASIADCTVDDYLTPPSSPSDACVPPTSANVLQTPAFLAVRQLSPESQRLYADALASQMAMTAIRSAILDLGSQIKQIDAKGGTDAQAQDVLSRKHSLQDQLAILEREADALGKLQSAKAETTRTQMLALDLVQRQLALVQTSTPSPRGTPSAFDALRGWFTW